MIFENDEARRAYFLERLREKLRDPDFRKIEGFPLGEEENILALSDPPYYTACPNPFIASFVQQYGRPYDPEERYEQEPFTTDVSEERRDPFYRLPSYYTKVPHRAIQRYLVHYTRPGDLVLDAFCGTGMTGLAALLLDRPGGMPGSERSCDGRHTILIDISPSATFTASILNAPLLPDLAAGAESELAAMIRDQIGPLYDGRPDQPGSPFDYAVWSEWGECCACGGTFRMFDVSIDHERGETLPEYSCPHCTVRQQSHAQKRAFETRFDPWLGQPVRTAKTTPVLLSRKVGNRSLRRWATEADVRLADSFDLPPRIQPAQLAHSHLTHERNNLPQYWGITHIHHFYTRRNYHALALVATAPEPHRRAALFALLTILENNATRRNRFYVDRWRPSGCPTGPLSNTLFVPALQVETNVGHKLLATLKQTASLSSRWPRGRSIVSTQSATQLAGIPDSSIDFVFTDPPFGGNIQYSEQNLLAEWWLQVFTNNRAEAITNPVQGKGYAEYADLMTRCFREYHRVLKPGRWMVVVFHNSCDAVWTAVQQAIGSSGFVVSTVSVLDNMHSTLHQDHKAGTVHKALSIAVCKPGDPHSASWSRPASVGTGKASRLATGSTEGVWEFVTCYLQQLPVTSARAMDRTQLMPERTRRCLFDRMVAFHLQRHLTLPLSAPQFYAGLEQRFPRRDGMYFLPAQVPEYERTLSPSPTAGHGGAGLQGEGVGG